ncbi:hypothetical protein ACFLWX_01930, partial [Chloroflexota bacterium]
MIKLHLFRGFENRRLGITPEMELGHLYSNTGDLAELREAARQLSLNAAWLQRKSDTGFVHYDI